MGKVLNTTKSVCPVCFKTMPAAVTSCSDGIYLKKECTVHGAFSALIWAGDEESYLAWDRPNEKKDAIADAKPVEKGCPHDCGLCEMHRRQTCCVLLEVTSRCNLGCPVCFASANERTDRDPDIQTIAGWYRALMAKGGPFNIQLSGGEPTMRDDLDEIIRIGRKAGFTFFQLNTNGLRLAEDIDYTKRLEEAGLNCVYLQFDSLKDTAYTVLRGQALLDIKKRVIEVCRKVGLGVVLVPTIVEGVNDDELGKLILFAAENLPTVRGIHFQPATSVGRFEVQRAARRLTIPDILHRIETQTSGAVRRADFTAGGAENSYCSFHANYIVGKVLKPVKQTGDSCCSSSQSREVVARQWTLKEEQKSACCGENSPYETDSLDRFLFEREQRMLSISGMLFQDAYNFDLNRVGQCYICEVTAEGGLVPFCAYNLTNTKGRYLHRR
jgi:hypothetical protein